MNYNERFFYVFERLKNKGLIKTYVQLATALSTNKAGINDIKSGKKKLTVDNILSMKVSYPQINTDFIIMGIGDALLSDSNLVEEPGVNYNATCSRCKDKDTIIQLLKEKIAYLEKKGSKPNNGYSQTA